MTFYANLFRNLKRSVDGVCCIFRVQQAALYVVLLPFVFLMHIRVYGIAHMNVCG